MTTQIPAVPTTLNDRVKHALLSCVDRGRRAHGLKCDVALLEACKYVTRCITQDARLSAEERETSFTQVLAIFIKPGAFWAAYFGEFKSKPTAPAPVKAAAPSAAKVELTVPQPSEPKAQPTVPAQSAVLAELENAFKALVENAFKAQVLAVSAAPPDKHETSVTAQPAKPASEPAAPVKAAAPPAVTVASAAPPKPAPVTTDAPPAVKVAPTARTTAKPLTDLNHLLSLLKRFIKRNQEQGMSEAEAAKEARAKCCRVIEAEPGLSDKIRENLKETIRATEHRAAPAQVTEFVSLC